MVGDRASLHAPCCSGGGSCTESQGSGDNKKIILPVPWMNVINGGSYISNRLVMQEIMIGATGSLSSQVSETWSEFHCLRGFSLGGISHCDVQNLNQKWSLRYFSEIIAKYSPGYSR